MAPGKPSDLVGGTGIQAILMGMMLTPVKDGKYPPLIIECLFLIEGDFR